MVDEETGKVVDKDEKGRGFAISKGRDACTIDEIDSFVPRSEIDNRYLDRPFIWLPPRRSCAEAFAVIRDAVEQGS